MGGKVIWITGLSGAGKTTLAERLVSRIKKPNFSPILLDGDILRQAWAEEAPTNYERQRRIAVGLRYSKICHILASQGFMVVIATISMFKEIHNWNRKNLPGYFEVYLKVPISELRRRDKNKIYSKFENAQIKYIAGLDVAVDEPANPDLVIKFDRENSSTDSAELLIEVLKKHDYLHPD